jgi:hypothetical protein
MASLNDVQNAMVNIITPAMYPNGTSSPSITTRKIQVAPGDFLKDNLDIGLAAGESFVAVFAVNGMTRSTTRVRREFVDPVINTAQLTLTVLGDTVTVGGTISAGEAAMVIVNGVGYGAKVVLGSTTTTIATELASLIPGATSLANVVTISNKFDIQAHVSTQGTAREILFSREAIFRARVISPSHDDRETIGNAIDIAFGLNGYYMMMPDLIAASIRPNSIMELNPYELDNAFLRDYLYLVEYHTVSVQTFQSIADGFLEETVDVIPLD